ncbi:hypothetical protein MYX65_05175 [Acidobacteria bacterium AH-259-L09]|nr:hypothetical protein [Acidobacteria bacterium AH-259-L09]
MEAEITNGQQNPRRPSVFCWLALPLLLATPLLWAQTTTARKAPETRRDNVKEVLHGAELVDPFRWLEDQESPETRAWIEAQNQYSDSILSALPGRERLQRRLTELMKVDTIGVPRERNGRYFFSKRGADQDLSVIYMRKGLTGEDVALIDPHPWSPDHSTAVTLMDVSQDGTLVAYGVRRGGEDEVAVHLLDVDTRKTLPDSLSRARYFGISLKPDNSGFYYTRHDKQGSRVYYHALGTDPARDRQIFGDGYGPDKIILASLSDDGRTLVFHVLHGSSADRTEIYFQDLAHQGSIATVVNDIDARFFAELGGERLFVHTNWKAPNGRLLAVDLKSPAHEHWREIIPESEAVIEGVSLVGGKIFVHYLENVRSAVKVFTPEGDLVRTIAFSALGSVRSLSGRW